MKKSYFLGLTLLFGVASGYAQKNIASLDDLKEVKAGLENLSDWQKEYDDRQLAIRDYEIEKNKLAPTVVGKDELVVVKFAEGLKSALVDFDNSVHADENDGESVKDKYLWFAVKDGKALVPASKIGNKAVARKASLIVLYDESLKDMLSNTEKSLTFVKVRGYDVTEESKLFVGENTNISSVRLYYIDKKYKREIDASGNTVDKEIIGYNSKLDSKLIETSISVDYDFVKLFAGSVSKLDLPADKESTEPGKDVVNPAIATMQLEINKLISLNDELKKKIDAVKTYNQLNVVSELTIDEAFTLPTLAKGATFNGNNNIIKCKEGFAAANLIGTNEGTISDVVAQNCNVVNRNNKDILEVNVKNGRVVINKGTGSHIVSSMDVLALTEKETNEKYNSYTVYGSDGSFASVISNKVATFNNIYSNATLREEFGVNVKAGTVTEGSQNKLYEVKQYSAKNKDGETRLANIESDGSILINRNWSNGENIGEFYYVSNTDAATIFDNAAIGNVKKNVVYTHDGNNWECKLAEVSDGNNSIYVPRAFTAANVNYKRVFNVAAASASTICLPFAVSESALNTMLGVNGKLLQFNKIDENGKTYWFKYVTGGMEANQPYVLKFGESVSSAIFDGLENVTFAATGADKRLDALAQADEAAGASLYGTFEKRTASELENGAKYSIYGFQNGEFVRMTEAVNFKATRAYVRSNTWTDPKAPNAAKSYKMGILDENDNDVTGISSVENAAGEFTVNGGNGAISINADKAQTVKVYTVGGALVKSADVEAGATSLPVSAGMYIVNGNKVVVK